MCGCILVRVLLINETPRMGMWCKGGKLLELVLAKMISSKGMTLMIRILMIKMILKG